MKNYNHWRLEGGTDQVLWLFFDRQNASVNTINREVMEELSDILDKLETSKEYKGVVIASAKRHGFIAGADVYLVQSI